MLVRYAPDVEFEFPPGLAQRRDMGLRSFAAFAPDLSAAAVVISNTARSVDRLGFRLGSNTHRANEACATEAVVACRGFPLLDGLAHG